MANTQGEEKPTLGIKGHGKLLILAILPLLPSPLEKVFNQGFLGGKAPPFKLACISRADSTRGCSAHTFVGTKAIPPTQRQGA